MYRREIPHLPNTVPRKQFVKEIFDLGLRFDYGYDTLITAVEIGDRFVSYKGDRVSYTYYKKKNKLSSDQINIITEFVPQIYSRELAYVSLVISADVTEDDGYSIGEVADELENGYVYKMQWEICIINDFCIHNNNFITLLGSLIWEANSSVDECTLSKMFWDLSLAICTDETLLYANPINIILAVIMLNNMGKLCTPKQYRERIFQKLMSQVAKEYDIPISNLLQAYIGNKSANEL